MNRLFFALSILVVAFNANASEREHGNSHGNSHESSSHHSDSHHEDNDDLSCPCYTEADLYAHFDASAACFDWNFSTPTVPEEGTVLETMANGGFAAGVAYQAEWGVPFCAAIDATNTGVFVFGISDDVFNSCADMVRDVAEELDLECQNMIAPEAN